MHRPFTRILRITLAAVFGGLLGFVGWFAAGVAGVIAFMNQGNISPEEMGHAREVVPSEMLLVVMVLVGALGGGLLGWRSGKRKKTLDDPL